VKVKKAIRRIVELLGAFTEFAGTPEVAASLLVVAILVIGIVVYAIIHAPLYVLGSVVLIAVAVVAIIRFHAWLYADD